MQWSGETSDALAALRTLLLNDGWGGYWQQRRPLSLEAARPQPFCAPRLVPLTAPRRRAGWPKEVSAAVDLALAAGAERPPHGITQADWERVLDARRQEATLTLEHLRHLGPTLEPDQVLLTIDAVLTRARQAHQFGEIRTARITTAEGTRCLSGTGEEFLQTLRVLTLLSVGPGRSLLLLADGARWIRAFFRMLVAPVPTTMMILDWWHLRQSVIR